MKDGIPNLSTPADLFDRLIIERLKVLHLMDIKSDNIEAISNAEKCVSALKVELSKLIAESSGDFSELADTFDHLVRAVSTVSFCENEKANLHKAGANATQIAELDRISRKANEDRAVFKRSINNIFEKLTDRQNLVEARTF